MLEWYGTTSEVPWLFLLSAWIIALLAVAGGYELWNRAGLRLSLAPKSVRPGPSSPLEDLPEHLLRTAPLPAALFEADALELEVGLDTTGPPARGPASVTGLVGGERVSLATGVVPRAGWRRSVEIAALRRGPLGASAWQIATSDFLGMFRGQKTCPDLEIGLVLPRFASLAGRLRAREVEASVAAPRAGAGTELFGVREYRSGDSLRRIHWRSSARRGELVVREYEPPGVHRLSLFLDADPPTGEVADQIARIAASEAWDCIRDAGWVALRSPGAEPAPPSRDLWAILEWLARYPYRPSGSGDSVDVPVTGDEVVIVTAGDPRLAEVRAARAWVVGDAPFELDIPFERVGTAWPL